MAKKVKRNEFEAILDMMVKAKTITDVEMAVEAAEGSEISLEQVDEIKGLAPKVIRKLTSKTTEVAPKGAPQVEEGLAEHLQDLMEGYPDVTLRKIAIATQTSYDRLLTASKKPIEGQVYDPNVRNYARLAFVLGVEKIDSIPWEELNTPAPTKAKVYTDIEVYKSGKPVYLRGPNPGPFTPALFTETHVVLIEEGNTKPLVWSHGTFISYGPVFEPRVK